MAKKYFWLKLKDDFFTDIRMKKLRRNAGGSTYTLIYLKLQLLSLKNEGILFYEEVEDSFFEEVAFKIDEDPVDVEWTLMFLMKHKLLDEVQENQFALIETMNSIGSETQAAERVRKHREIKNNAKKLQCNTSETSGNTEIEKELELELELEKNNVPSKEVTKLSNKMPIEMVKMILEYFTEKMDRQSKPFKDSDSTVNLLNNLYKAKYTDIAGYQFVIDNKYNEWINNDEFKKRLIPATLFAKRNFEKYIEEDELLEPLPSKNDRYKKNEKPNIKYELDRMIEEEERNEQIRSNQVIQGNGQVLLEQNEFKW